jgi:hypothetical protein
MFSSPDAWAESLAERAWLCHRAEASLPLVSRSEEAITAAVRAAAWIVSGILAVLASAGAASAEDAPLVGELRAGDTVCSLIDAAAARNNLPVDFLTRLVWRESHFAADAVSPKGAQGIAQFMPGTAALRGLDDPFDARSAISASAAYLSDLKGAFGNLGLAAAAYNAGERRTADWLAGDASLPWETENYVIFVTGRTAEEWKADRLVAAAEPASVSASIVAAPPTPSSAAACTDIAAVLAKGAGAAVVPASLGSAPWAPWGVQVGGDFSATRALASYAALQKRYPTIIGSRQPLLVRSVMMSRGRAPFTNVRVPAASRQEADALCRDLHAAGGACIVMRNTR